MAIKETRKRRREDSEEKAHGSDSEGDFDVNGMLSAGESESEIDSGSEDGDEGIVEEFKELVSEDEKELELDGDDEDDSEEEEDDEEDEDEDEEMEDEEEEDSDDDEEPIHKLPKPRTYSEASKPSASSITSDTEYQVDDDLPEGTRVVKDSSGNARYIYPEIDPRYDTDDTDVEEANTIGDIPLDKYELYPHIGYDINGERIMRPATGEALDALLEQIDLPKGWTGIVDKNTGKGLNLSREELDILKKITRNEIPEEGYDPYPVSLSRSERWGWNNQD